MEKSYDDDSESIITNERYEVITKAINSAVQKVKVKVSISDKIDSIISSSDLTIS